MGITCNNFYTNFANISEMNTNNIGSSNASSNITFSANINVNGDVFAKGRMDTSTTIFASFHLTSNQPFVTPELVPASNMMVMDFPRTNMADMVGIPMSVPRSNVYEFATGNINVPVSGLYSLEMQGSFSTSDTLNGVYYRFLNHPYPNARVAANIDKGSILSTSHIAFLLGGDILQPVFYSEGGSNTMLLADSNETYVSFSVLSTTTPTASNFVRL